MAAGRSLRAATSRWLRSTFLRREREEWPSGIVVHLNPPILYQGPSGAAYSVAVLEGGDLLAHGPSQNGRPLVVGLRPGRHRITVMTIVGQHEKTFRRDVLVPADSYLHFELQTRSGKRVTRKRPPVRLAAISAAG